MLSKIIGISSLLCLNYCVVYCFMYITSSCLSLSLFSLYGIFCGYFFCFQNFTIESWKVQFSLLLWWCKYASAWDFLLFFFFGFVFNCFICSSFFVSLMVHMGSVCNFHVEFLQLSFMHAFACLITSCILFIRKKDRVQLTRRILFLFKGIMPLILWLFWTSNLFLYFLILKTVLDNLMVNYIQENLCDCWNSSYILGILFILPLLCYCVLMHPG